MKLGSLEIMLAKNEKVLSEYSSPRKPSRELLDYPNMNLTLTLNVFLNSIYLCFVLLIPF